MAFKVRKTTHSNQRAIPVSEKEIGAFSDKILCTLF